MLLTTDLSHTDLGASIKREKLVEICEGCGQKIQDRYLMRVGELSWHEQCLSCCVCGCPLAHTCYTRNAKLYCKPDYDRYYVTRSLPKTSLPQVTRKQTSPLNQLTYRDTISGIEMERNTKYL